jgi:hypothetical protein
MPSSLSFAWLSSSRNGGSWILAEAPLPRTPNIAPSHPRIVFITILRRRDASGTNDCLVDRLVQVAAIIQLSLRIYGCASTLDSANVT